MTCTIDKDGTVLTETIDDITYLINYSFKLVNDYVHDPERHFEELQYLCLGMANEIEKLQNSLGVNSDLLGRSECNINSTKTVFGADNRETPFGSRNR